MQALGNHPMVILRLMEQDCWVCPLSLDTALSLSFGVQMGALNSSPWPLNTFCYSQIQMHENASLYQATAKASTSFLCLICFGENFEVSKPPAIPITHTVCLRLMVQGENSQLFLLPCPCLYSATVTDANHLEL